MGVFGLWDLLMTTAQKININQLSGKILAIDASIWLVKADSIFSEDSQKIKFILQKIVYLRKNNILPIFVFDGIPPAIKRKTLEKRKQKLKQGSQIDVRKKTQIEVMHLLENIGKQKSDKQASKDKKILEKQEQMTQIDKLLDSLSQVQAQKSQIITDDDINKIRLQSQVLTYKYQLMVQDPRLQGLQKMQLNDFQLLGIEEKLQYLHLLENEYHSRNAKRNRFQTIKELSKLTPEEQIFYDMQKIQKKTKLRQLQDQLYRKTIQQKIKIQNGYEIIEEIRNGKKFIMKRKINTQNDKQSWYSKGSKKQKNDFSAIFNYKNEPEEGQNFQQKDEFDMYGNEPDPFLLDLMGKDLSKNKQDQDSNSKTKNSLHLNLKTKAWEFQNQKEKKQKQQKQQKSKKIKEVKNENNQQEKEKLKKQKQKNALKKQTKKMKQGQELSQKQSSELNEIVLASFIGQNIRKSQNNNYEANNQELERDKNNSTNSQVAEGFSNQNPDNLPQFINYQNLLIRHLDTQNSRNIEFQKLLQMIGIPYIKAVSQAEAQCASLQMSGLVDGVVTEDSDVFLFGAKNVFRGVFNDNIKYFSAHKIMEKLKLNREKLIIFAMLLGSDYTEGIKGIGIVNAMEILKIFDDFDKLQKFKRWGRYADILQTDEKNVTQNIVKQLSNEEEKQFYEFHKRFKNYWYIDDDFPKMSVINAYLNPEVIDNVRVKEMKDTKYFELKYFNEQAVRIFMQERLLLTYSETEDYCENLKKVFVRQKQKKVTDFFVGQDHEFAKIRSKRLMKALGQYNDKNQNPANKIEQVVAD